MKKILFVLIFALSILMLVSCSKDKSETDSYETVTLTVYNWGEYISDGFQGSFDTNAEFEKYFNKNLAVKYGVKVKVVYTTYPTNEDMFEKIKSGAGSYDIVFPSDYMIEKMIEEDMLLSYDVAADIENFKYIEDQFKGNYYDPENRYSVPYTYGMLGVIYNKELVDKEDYDKQSWELLWNDKYKGKILQFNNQRDAFATAMYALGLDVNSTDTAVWNTALEKMSAQKPLVQAYVNDEIFNKMTTASAAIAPYFAGDFITMADLNEDLDFYYPKEGTNVFYDAMCILKDSKNPEIAKEYINYMLSEEPAIANATYIGYASPNTLVKNNEGYKEEMGARAISLLYGISPESVNAEYNSKYETASYKMFSKDMQSHVNTLWESLKTENATEPWIHISTALIVGSVVALAGYNIYIKKKRSRDYRIRDKQKRLAAKANKH